MPGDRRSLWQASAAFLVFPGVVAFLVPWAIRPPGADFRASAVPLLVLGAVLLLWCVRDFYVIGRGTLAPWAPPETLVVVGLYRYSRNPMYLTVLLIVSSWALVFPSRTVAAYAVCLGVAFHLRVVLAEEPWLAKRHGTRWLEYRSRVPRWLPSLRGRRRA